MSILTLAPDLASIVRPAWLWLDGATVVERDARMDGPLAEAEALVRVRPPEAMSAVRTMYKRVGLDPTKRRPSSEALLRRVLKGESLPRVNSMVDVCNWCSLESQLPFGLYDADRIHGDVVLRLGHPGESYPGIRKDEVNVSGRIALADSEGPFGNPTSDSARTMVTAATTRALVVVFAPCETDMRRLGRVVEMTAKRMADYTGAHEAGRHVG